MMHFRLYIVGKHRPLPQGTLGDLGLQNPNVPRELVSCPGLLAL